MTCGGCQAALEPGALRCPACGALQPPGPPGDPFADLGLPRAFALDSKALDRAHGDRARLVHPDRHVRAAPAQRRLAQDLTARLNAARAELADPLRRAEALLRLAGQEPLGDPAADPYLPAFLAGQLERRERLAEARGRGDGAACAALAGEARRWLAGLPGRLGALLDGPRPPGTDARAPLREAARLLHRARFQQALAAEAEGQPRPGGA